MVTCNGDPANNEGGPPSYSSYLLAAPLLLLLHGVPSHQSETAGPLCRHRQNWHLKRLLKKASLSGSCSGGFNLKQILRQIIAKCAVTNPPTSKNFHETLKVKQTNSTKTPDSAALTVSSIGSACYRADWGNVVNLKLGEILGLEARTGRDIQNSKIKCPILLFTYTLDYLLPEPRFLKLSHSRAVQTYSICFFIEATPCSIPGTMSDTC